MSKPSPDTVKNTLSKKHEVLSLAEEKKGREEREKQGQEKQEQQPDLQVWQISPVGIQAGNGLVSQQEYDAEPWSGALLRVRPYMGTKSKVCPVCESTVDQRLQKNRERTLLWSRHNPVEATWGDSLRMGVESI